MYQILNLKSSLHLRELFIRRPSDATRPYRYPLSSYMFYIPNHRTTTYRNSFHLSAIYFWPSLPDNVTAASALTSFKVSLSLSEYQLQSEIAGVQ